MIIVVAEITLSNLVEASRSIVCGVSMCRGEVKGP
jgi:hypothetical protein